MYFFGDLEAEDCLSNTNVGAIALDSIAFFFPSNVGRKMKGSKLKGHPTDEQPDTNNSDLALYVQEKVRVDPGTYQRSEEVESPRVASSHRTEHY